MSIHRLNSFIKENYHDILDYWVDKTIVRYVRVCSHKTGHIYMVKVQHYNIALAEDRDTLMKNQIYYLDQLDDCDDVPKNLSKLYDTFLSAFPEHRNRFIIHHSNYLMESRDSLRRVCNYPSDGYFNVHLFVELEWFYENLFIVNHEMDRSMSTIFSKSQKIYEGFIPMYTDFIRKAERDISIVEKTWNYFMEQRRSLLKCQKFYISLCSSEHSCHSDLIELGNIRSEELSFQDTVRRSHKRKTIHEKLSKLRTMHISTMERLVYFHSIHQHLLLHFLYFLSDITLLLTRFHSHFLELENLIPRHDKLEL